MKAIAPLLAAFASAALLSSLAIAADRPPKTPIDGRKQIPKDSPWNVRAEVLMVTMPQEKALAMLPDLRNPAKIEAAVAEIMSAIARKEATLMGYPVAQTLGSVRNVAETVIEKRYPTEFEVPTTPQNGTPAPPPPTAAVDSFIPNPVPTAFETRNLGVTLEVEPHVSANGDWIRVDVVAQRVALLGFDSYDGVKMPNGKVSKVDQPLFSDTKANAALKLRNGQWCLLAVHKLTQPDNQIEFFIIQASATSTK